LWEQRVRDLAPPNDAAAMSPADLKVPGVSAVQADQTVRDLR
jgi:hypothetical protein